MKRINFCSGGLLTAAFMVNRDHRRSRIWISV